MDLSRSSPSPPEGNPLARTWSLLLTPKQWLVITQKNGWSLTHYFSGQKEAPGTYESRSKTLASFFRMRFPCFRAVKVQELRD